MLNFILNAVNRNERKIISFFLNKKKNLKLNKNSIFLMSVINLESII